ncbi:hypothetical protein D3C78_1509330 [compost metagenome]
MRWSCSNISIACSTSLADTQWVINRCGSILPLAIQSMTCGKRPLFRREEKIDSSLLVMLCWVRGQASPEKPMMPIRAAGDARLIASCKMAGWQAASTISVGWSPRRSNSACSEPSALLKVQSAPFSCAITRRSLMRSVTITCFTP